MYILISTEFHDLIVLIIKSSANCRTVIDHENIFLQQNNILKNTAHITLYFHHFEEFWCRILNKELHFIFKIWRITNMYLFIMFAICKYKSRLYVFDDKLEIVLQYMFISIYILYYQGFHLKNKNIKSILIFFLLLFIMFFQRTTTLFSTWQKMNDNQK